MKMRISDYWSNFGRKAKVSLNLTPRCLSEFGVYSQYWFSPASLSSFKPWVRIATFPDVAFALPSSRWGNSISPPRTRFWSKWEITLSPPKPLAGFFRRAVKSLSK